MITTLSIILGGIGLFLLGMILMTDGLKALAGDAMRFWLGRFTGRRSSAVLTGAGITALVQSSSATTLATIGFVSAGLLSFQNSIGVMIGANIGTTSTGWIVSLLGLKLSVGTIALPLIGLGALARLLGRNRTAQAGLALAGFGVIFVGIDTLQQGMAGLSAYVTPGDLPSDSLGGRLLLVLLGAGMTVIMQSSSAAVATTLTALAGGTISLEQAAALVIGQNVGTTLTAILAAIGASTAARRTAVVHVCFNIGTGMIAFAVLPLFVHGVEDLTEEFAPQDHALTIAAFHTAFNLLGALIFIPLIPQMARFATYVVPERGLALTRHLDNSQQEIPAVAVQSAQSTLQAALAQLLGAASARLRGDELLPERLAEVESALIETEAFLARFPQPGDAELQRLVDLLHLLDHMKSLARNLQDSRHQVALHESAGLRMLAGEVAHCFDESAAGLVTGGFSPEVERLAALSRRISDQGRSVRPEILANTAARRIGLETALAELSAQRWIDRLVLNAWRAMLHLSGDRSSRPAGVEFDA